jgi:peptidoglycan/xylan/chitin deacetylase (PgdA/CDA1 family)
MDIEKRLGVRSTFFFLKETKKRNILHPSSYILSLGHYDFNEPAVSEIIKKLDSGGWEIGLHGSYDSYKKKELLVKEKKELEEIVGKPVIGIRQHFLNIEIPRTWKIQQEIGFLYDTTFGLKKDIGFLENRYLPFQPFDDPFLVIPLTVMDGSLFSQYPDEKSKWEKIKEVIHKAKETKGVVSFLWHQRVFNEKEFPGWAPLYEKIIQECKEENAWFATGRDIYEWMKKNR